MPTAPLKPDLPTVPAKRYFTIGEVSELCAVKQHVLRYWEQEFNQLKPMKRRGNRRYYQHHEVMLIRRIRSLLYDEGFTISGARLKLDTLRGVSDAQTDAPTHLEAADENWFDDTMAAQTPATPPLQISAGQTSQLDAGALRAELAAIAKLLG